MSAQMYRTMRHNPSMWELQGMSPQKGLAASIVRVTATFSLKSVGSMGLTPLLAGAMQEQQTIIETLQQGVEQLEGER